MKEQREITIREKFFLGQLREGLNDLTNKFEDIGQQHLTDNARRLLSNYDTMLSYVSAGTKDPKQQELWSKIYDEGYKLIYLYEMTQAGKTKPDCRIDDIPLSDYETLFDAIENNFPATKEDRKRIQEIILDDKNPLYLRGMVLSALTLNLLNYFDIEKFESLYTYTLDDQPLTIRQRAWVAIALVTMANDHHISTQPRLVEQMKFICEEGLSKENCRPLLVTQYALYQCLQSLKARDIMTKDIMPEIANSLNIVKESTDEEDEIAPRWAEYLEKSGINKKIQQFVELQQNGVDVLIDSFSKTANKTPFFAKKCNWFTPFDTEHPAIKPFTSENSANDFLTLINKAGNMCSTDKYGHMSVLAGIPGKLIKHISITIKADNPEIIDSLEVLPEDEINGYLHDIFRYFYISRSGGKDSSYNPFKHHLYFNHYSNLALVVDDLPTKHMLADLCLNNNDWEGAMDVLSDLIKTTPAEEVLQKYIYASLKDNENYECCMDMLSRCNAMYPGNQWTMLHYAKALAEECSFYHEEAILREACRLFPDDVRFIVLLGKCLIDLQRYQEAIEQLYKADLMKENNYRTLSLLVEAALWNRNKELAEKHIEQVLKMPKAAGCDWLNGGHLALINGDMALAIERYRNAGEDFFTEIEMFERPRDLLLSYGVPLEKICLAFEVVSNEC